MRQLVEEYGMIVINAMVGTFLLAIGCWIFTALAPLVEAYISEIG